MARFKVWVKDYGSETVMADKCKRSASEYLFKKRGEIVARFPLEHVVSVRREPEPRAQV